MRLLYIGIAGAIFTMMGDCLLCGADSSGAAGMIDSFMIIASKISYMCIGLAGSFGFIGIPLSAAGYYALYLLLSEADRDSRLGKMYRLSVLGGYASMGGAVHILCCYIMTGLKKNIEAGTADVVSAVIKEQIGYLLPCMIIFLIVYIVVVVSFILIISKGKTLLPKWMWVLNPLVMKAVFNVFRRLGTSALCNGIACSNMSLGALVIFLCWIMVIRSRTAFD